jgi:hypothetical protein
MLQMALYDELSEPAIRTIMEIEGTHRSL